MKLGSACSGIGCIDLGLERAGFEPVWQIEIDATCRSVLARHWPNVRRHDDLADAYSVGLEPVDLIAGGTPCPAWSVAGKGGGLDDPRTQVFFDFIRLADSQPWAFVLWENVPGVLAQSHAEDFAICLEGFTGARPEIPEGGWRNSGVAIGPLRWACWSVHNAEYFGVAQRRRRVYLVAGPRGRCGPEVLLESEGVRGDPPPSREAGAQASTLTAGRPGSGRRREDDLNVVGSLQTVPPGGGWRIGAAASSAGQIVSALTSSEGGVDDNDAQAGRIIAGGSDHAEGVPEVLLDSDQEGDGRSGADVPGVQVVGTLTGHETGGGYRLDDTEARGGQIVVDIGQITHPENRANPQPGDPSPTLVAAGRPITYAIKGAAIGRKPEAEPQRGEVLDDGSCYTLDTVDRHAVAQAYQCHGSNVGPMGTLRGGNGNEAGGVPFVASPLTASVGKTTDTAGSGGSGPKNLPIQGGRPRRLVPVETERLQGLPDGWTKYRSDGSEIADGPRYRMIGNGAAVPHVEWIGRRLAKAIR